MTPNNCLDKSAFNPILFRRPCPGRETKNQLQKYIARLQLAAGHV